MKSTDLPVLDVSGLKTTFRTEEGVVTAVRDASFRIPVGRTLGLVGESGSGKSVTSLSILRLLPDRVARVESGEIRFLGRDLLGLAEREMLEIRGAKIAMIFQEPMTSLNPVFTVGEQVMEAIRIHQKVPTREAKERTVQLFREVGIPDPEQRVGMYPHEMSGGQQQRVMIAMALSCNPELLIADEPTTALDVTIQAQILELLRNLQRARGMSILFITHDLGVISEIADEVAVMYRGRIVEHGPVVDVFERPRHPYTKGLLACRPRLSTRDRRLPVVSDFMEVRETPSGEVEILERRTGGATAASANANAATLDVSANANASAPEHDGVRGAELDEARGAKDHAPRARLESADSPLLSVRDLCVSFPIKKGILQRVVGQIHAVDHVSFDVHEGKTLGLVGESGCGKTTTGRAILRLIPLTGGEVLFRGRDLAQFSKEELRLARREMQIVFQDPYGSLNPRLTVETALTEPMEVHGIGSSRSDRRDRAVALLGEVGLDERHLRRFPHEFSGGQRQRLCIARALSVDPHFIICDESVSSLDVSVQAQILNLLRSLQAKRNLTYVFISHDLAVVKFMADTIAIMNAGKIVEIGPAAAIYESPREDYTKRLLSAIPDDRIESIRRRVDEREAARSAVRAAR